MNTHVGTSRRVGFTLVEMVVSLSVMSVIMLSLSSVVMIASRAVPDDTEGVHAELELARVMGDLERDLTCATRVNMDFDETVGFIEIDLGVVSIGLGVGGKGVVGGSDTVDSFVSTALAQMDISVPAGNDGVGSSTIRYTYDSDAKTLSRQVGGTVRAPDVYSVEITAMEVQKRDERGYMIAIELTHENGETTKSVAIRFRNAPDMEVT